MDFLAGVSIPSFIELPRAANCEIRSLVGYKNGHVLIAPLRCNSWGCLRCSARMTTIWANRVGAAAPERMVTFTNIGETREEINLGLQHIIRRLRKENYTFEYWGVVELHKSRKPHMHLLQRGGYIPKSSLQWAVRSEGWGHCDIRKVNTGWSAVRYCAKHLCHSHGRRWNGRLIRQSRHFFAKSRTQELAESKDPDISWAMVWGRADCVTKILHDQGFVVTQSALGEDWLQGEMKEGTTVQQTRRRSNQMGYGLLDSDELRDLSKQWREGKQDVDA
jgi:hypothetical protein